MVNASQPEVPSTAGLQDVLFEGDFAPLPEDIGFRGPIACSAAGITYRQLDYWARTGLVVPEHQGRRRLWALTGSTASATS
jgi:hypothetical protein